MFDDVNLAVDLSGRLVRAHGKLGRTQEAAVLADSVASLVESAFDWDSLMTAEARRESGEHILSLLPTTIYSSRLVIRRHIMSTSISFSRATRTST